MCQKQLTENGDEVFWKQIDFNTMNAMNNTYKWKYNTFQIPAFQQ